MKTIIILICALILVFLVLTFCIATLVKINKKLKLTQQYLDSTTVALSNATNLMRKGIDESLKELKENIKSIVTKSKEEFNNSSNSAENILVNGGFKKVEK